MSVNVPLGAKHSTHPLTSTFSASEYALRTICSLFMGNPFRLMSRNTQDDLAVSPATSRCRRRTSGHDFPSLSRIRKRIHGRDVRPEAALLEQASNAAQAF